MFMLVPDSKFELQGVKALDNTNLKDWKLMGKSACLFL